jgi:YVTN family beta-propeller protein
MFVSLVLLALLQAANGQNYKLLKSIPIGDEGGWDYLSIDAKARKLYVTHASKIVIVDLAQDKVVGEIADTPGVHGFAIAPELGHGFSSNGAESRVSVIDLKTLKAITKIETGENPDAVLYEPARSEVYAFNGRGKSATVIDAKIDKVVAAVPLSGKPEFAAADAKSGRVFCNIEDKNEVAVIDTKTHSVIASWPLAPGEEPTGMAFDGAHHRLFVGCHNKMMSMLDSDSGKIIATVPIGAGVDACAFDDATQLAFASCGDHRERGNAGQTHGRANAHYRAWCAHDGPRFQNATRLHVRGANRARAGQPVTGDRRTSPSQLCAGHISSARLRNGIGEEDRDRGQRTEDPPSPRRYGAAGRGRRSEYAPFASTVG